MSTMLWPSIRCAPLAPSPGAQGIVRVAVIDGPPTGLVVTFARAVTDPAGQGTLDSRAYALTGGQRLFPKIVTAALQPDAPGTPTDQLNQRVALGLDGPGDFSVYTLTVTADGVDPFFASRSLRFRLSCDDPFDCQSPPGPAPTEPELNVAIDYLAKDYSSFRQALLDFVGTRFPFWTERSEADLGMMILELFAYAADQLSDTQDRVANEAFLSTAKQRRSIAGLLALVGYALGNGASACTWLQFRVKSLHTLAAGTALRVGTKPQLGVEPTIVFETIGSATFRPEHNQIPLFNWGMTNCCLPASAVSAELDGAFPYLAAGDFLLFDDGSGTRDVVRLTTPARIVPSRPVGSPPASRPITLVSWSKATPLRSDYCVNHTVASANLVGACHGETTFGESLQGAASAPSAGSTLPRRLRLSLANGPLAYLDPVSVAAVLDPSTPAPSAGSNPSTLMLSVNDTLWQEAASLLDSAPDDQVFRVETDDQGDATVVFGDGVSFGARPDSSASIVATYRVGGGSSGNVGPGSLCRVLPRDGDDVSWVDDSPNAAPPVSNPLAAFGGSDRESSEHARRFGPDAVRQPLVAVTTADYQDAALAYTDALGSKPVRRANARFRWTGSWMTVTLAVDLQDSQPLDAATRLGLLAYLDTRRLAGYDLDVIPPNFVAVDLAVELCIRPGSAWGDVEQAVLLALSSGVIPGGQLGFFHPDNFNFGEPLYLSRLYAALLGVPGVGSATVTRLARLRALDPNGETAANLRQGFLAAAADQIIRLDNDRNFPEHGTLTLRQKGVSA
jgi:hypothetical protein